MRALHVLLAVALLPVLGLEPARAAEPPLSPEQLAAEATHIVTGRVVQVFSAEKSEKPGFVDLDICIEVVVAKVEKGEGLAPDRVVYIRTSQTHKRPAGWVGGTGQRHVPRPGESIRAHLRRAENGAFEALKPNGIAPVEAGAAPGAAEGDLRGKWRATGGDERHPWMLEYELKADGTFLMTGYPPIAVTGRWDVTERAPGKVRLKLSGQKMQGAGTDADWPDKHAWGELSADGRRLVYDGKTFTRP